MNSLCRHFNAELVALFVAVSVASTSAHAVLNEGKPAPGFQAPAALAGKVFSFSLEESLKKGPVVVYFYPSAYTNGCNVQAHTFAERNERFVAAGATIVGVSLDSIARLKTFSADPDFCAGKIAVASDADGRIARAYGVLVRAGASGRKDTRGEGIDHDFAERTTFVVGRDGRIAAVVGGVSPVENVERALNIVQGLGPARRP